MKISKNRAVIEQLENRRLLSAAIVPAPAPYQIFTVTSHQFSGQVFSWVGLPQNQVPGLTTVIRWGDGTRSFGNIVMNGNAADIDGSHYFGSTQGSIPVKVVLWQNYGTITSRIFGSTYVIAEYNLPGATAITTQPIVTSTGAFAGMLGKFDVPFSSSDLKSAVLGISWGDGQFSSGTLRADPNGGTDVYGNHRYAANFGDDPFYEVAISVNESPAEVPGQPSPDIVFDLGNFDTTINDVAGVIMPLSISRNTFNTSTPIGAAAPATNPVLD